MKKRMGVVLSVLIVMFCFLALGKTKVWAASAYDGNSLDVGIYWFGKDNISQKFVAGTNNPYYDPTKPTIIYIHGWQPNAYKSLFRESFNPYLNDSSCGSDVDLADYWIDKGWNIGIFYWNQLADETNVYDAESKIWSTAGAQGMRWRKADGSYVTTSTPSKSVGNLFADAYASAMANFQGSEIRIAGHSLGSQVAVDGTKLISDMVATGKLSNNLLPDRVALLDPFWSIGSKSYLSNQWTGAVCRTYVNALKEKGVAFEEYKSSNIMDVPVADSNAGMRSMVCFQDLWPEFINFTNQSGKHGYARTWYFYSMAFSSPAEVLSGAVTGNVAASASTSTARIAQMMNSSYKWIQSNGKKTETPMDDTFLKQLK